MADHAQTQVFVPTCVGRLRVQVVGSGPLAVLWHSLFVDSSSWIRVQSQLAQDRRLLLIDGPSHGGSEAAPHRFGLEDCAQAAVEVLREFQVGEPVDWLGSAWGGHVGLLFAAAYPNLCRTLLAVGAPVHPLSQRDRRRIGLLAVVYRLAGAGPVTPPLVSGLLGPVVERVDPAAIRLVVEAFRRADRRAMYHAVRWLSLGRADLTPTLERITAPTLLTTVPDDPLWLVPDAEAAAAHLHHGASAVLPCSGHLGPLLEARTLVDLTRRFWRDPDATVSRYREAMTDPTTPPSRHLTRSEASTGQP